MIKVKYLSFIFGFWAVFFFSSVFAYGEDMSGSVAEEKARQAHEKAASDFVYQSDEWKALYYQNVRMIQLLKEIRDSLQNMRQQDGQKKSE